jgi:hypothetical protein
MASERASQQAFFGVNRGAFAGRMYLPLSTPKTH